ncbi:MAG: acetyl-CoA carboxylase carboxyl transferase subunit alpha, partial [Candidatus Latescibacterota bacterium]
MAVLDFERPIVELEEKLAGLRRYAEQEGVDLSDQIARLERELERLRREVFSKLSPWQRVQLARHPDRPYTLDYINRMTADFTELHGDRCFGDDPAVVGGLAKLEGRSVVVVGHQKGRGTKENLQRRFGMPNPEGYRKALRIMRLGAKFGLPVVSFVDTPGAYPGIEAEERGQAEAIARNLYE